MSIIPKEMISEDKFFKKVFVNGVLENKFVWYNQEVRKLVLNRRIPEKRIRDKLYKDAYAKKELRRNISRINKSIKKIQSEVRGALISAPVKASDIACYDLAMDIASSCKYQYHTGSYGDFLNRLMNLYVCFIIDAQDEHIMLGLEHIKFHDKFFDTINECDSGVCLGDEHLTYDLAEEMRLGNGSGYYDPSERCYCYATFFFLDNEKNKKFNSYLRIYKQTNDNFPINYFYDKNIQNTDFAENLPLLNYLVRTSNTIINFDRDTECYGIDIDLSLDRGEF